MQLNLLVRTSHHILKLVRTIVDLAENEEIQSAHLAETLQYRLQQETTRLRRNHSQLRRCPVCHSNESQNNPKAFLQNVIILRFTFHFMLLPAAVRSDDQLHIAQCDPAERSSE